MDFTHAAFKPQPKTYFGCKECFKSLDVSGYM